MCSTATRGYCVLITNKVQAEAVLAELRKRQEAAGAGLFAKNPVPLSDADRELFLTLSHNAQKLVLLDECKRIALLCPRRTGKSTTFLFRALIAGKIHPGSNVAYIVPSSRHHAKRLFWNPLMQMDRKLKLGLDFKTGEHRVITREQSSIYVFGAKNKDAPRVLRVMRGP